MDNKSICAMPWFHTMVDTKGDVRPCCLYSDTVKKEDGTPYNFGKDDINEAFTSEYYDDVRKKMLSGEEVSGCKECYRIEQYGGKSNRISANEYWPHVFETDPKITYLDIRTGNLCNLSCKSCTPLYSSTLLDEIESDPELQPYFEGPYSKDTSWYKTTMFDQNIESLIDNVDRYYFTGGEPTINERTLQLLEQLIASGKTDATLAFNTNLTNINAKFYSLIQQFKKIDLFISIDGTEKIQEYLRYPSKWSAIDSNLRKLLGSNINLNMVVTPVIQLTNINKCVEFFKYIDSLNDIAGSRVIDIHPIDLRLPEFLSVVNLPADFKTTAWEQIATWLSETKYQYTHIEEKLESIKNKCYAPGDKDKLSMYVHYNSIFDRKRKIQLVDANPELAELLNDPSLWS